MSIKMPKVAKTRRVRADIVTLNNKAKQTVSIESSAQMNKAFNISSSGKSSFRLYNRLVNDIGSPKISAYVSFIREEWDEGLSKYLANEFDRGSLRRGPSLSLDFLVDHYNTSLYLFKRCQVNKDDYLASIGTLDWGDVEKTTDQEIADLKRTVKHQSALNKKAAKRMQELVDENRRLRTKEVWADKLHSVVASVICRIAPSAQSGNVLDYLQCFVGKDELQGLPDYLMDELPENKLVSNNRSPEEIGDAIAKSFDNEPMTPLRRFMGG